MIDEEPRGYPLGGVLDLLGMIWAVDHALQKRSKRMQAALGITGPQRLVLRIVGRFPGIPAGDLASVMHVDASTVTGIVQRLQRRGLVRRRTDPRDRRRVLLGLTAQGRQLDVAHSGTIEAAVGQALGEMSSLEVDGTRKLLGRLTALLEEMS